MHGRPAAARPVVLLAVTVVLLLAAALSLLRCGGREPAPADQFLGFYCTACKQSFQLSAREFERRLDRGEVGTSPGGQFQVRCTHCDAPRAVRADTPADIAAAQAAAERPGAGEGPSGPLFRPPDEDRGP